VTFAGVVTFLLTDIEGSTRRWEVDADGMRVALAARDEVMTPVINTSDVGSADGEEPKPIAAAGTLLSRRGLAPDRLGDRRALRNAFPLVTRLVPTQGGSGCEPSTSRARLLIRVGRCFLLV
jgi:hypothetical protein